MAANESRGTRGRPPPGGAPAPRKTEIARTAGSPKRPAPASKPRPGAGNPLRTGSGEGGPAGKGAPPKPAHARKAAGQPVRGKAACGNQAQAASRLAGKAARESAIPAAVESRPRRFTVKPGLVLKGAPKAASPRPRPQPAPAPAPAPAPPPAAEPAVSGGVRTVEIADDRAGQ